jgi:hypothetical protein
MKKATKRSTLPNLYQLLGVPAPGHDKAFSKITDFLLELVMGSLDVNGQMGVTKSGSYFEMFELDKVICDTLRLPVQTLLMLDFNYPLPVMAWEKDDLRKLEDKTVTELKRIGIELEAYRGRFDLIKML